MGKLKVNLDEKADKCIGLAKAIARGEGNRRLDGVHVVKAVIVAYPEEAATYFRQSGSGWSDALWDLVTPPEGFQAESNRMPVAKELAGIVRKLGQGGTVVTLEKLLKAILRDPSVRVKALLYKAGGIGTTGCRGENKGGARPRFFSKRDWLAALHTEWKLRRAAARACGLSVGFGGSDDSHTKPYSSGAVLDAAVRIAAANRYKAEASPSKFDPLASLAGDFGPVERVVCEGLLVDAFYGLEVHPLPGIPARDLARLTSPELYPVNCAEVLGAIEGLKHRDVVSSPDVGYDFDLATRVHLSPEAQEQIVNDFAQDGISAGEVSAIKRRLRFDGDWGDGGLPTAI